MDELFSIESAFLHEQKRQELENRAKELKVKTAFNKLYNARKKDFIKAGKKKKTELSTPEEKGSVTEFSVLKDRQLWCGDWIADDNGVYIHTDKGIAEACKHPIYPKRILRNAETGQYKVELEFVIRGKTRKALVDRSVIATTSKIVNLANESVQVTAISAPYLVKYLSDVEALNPDIIEEVSSTSRLGWITDTDDEGNEKKMFLPYDKEVVFDNELNTKSLFESIRKEGSREKWYDTVKQIRAKKQTEVLINLAASFASALVEPCGALPFIVSLWGGTGIGKTVVLMLATSVWADPSEGQYMTDAKATSTAMEIRLNILNSLPMTLDDMAQIKNQQDEDFSQLIYRWCAGKGRDRSNVNLGLNKLTSWRNCIITNGERSMVDESTQGGAVNRVIDIENDGSVLFSGEDGNRVANILRKNFGFAGKEWIDLLETIDSNYVSKMVNEYFQQIKDVAAEDNCEKEDKQILPMALILTADELSEQFLFQDGIRLDVKKCVSYLKNKGEVSEHKRAYEYIRDTIRANDFHFKDNKDEQFERTTSCWGYYETEDVVYIIPSVFDKLVKEGKFQPRAFKSWLCKQGLIDHDIGRNDKMVRNGSSRCRYIVLKLSDNSEEDELLEEDNPFK